MAEICWDREKWRKEGTVGLSFLDVSSFYPSNLSSKQLWFINCFCAWILHQDAFRLEFLCLPNPHFPLGFLYVVLELALKLLFYPGETRKNFHGRKEEWQLEECQEQIAHEYDKLYGRKGTQPLLAAPWQRWRLSSRMTNHSEQAHYKVKILYHAGQLLQMLLC